MYEAELGHTLVDAIAILFCFWAVFSKRKAGCRNILRATLLSFTADVALEALLADTALGAKAAALELRDAFCVSGHSTAMMSLSHLPSVIATLAWVNMGLAIVGCTSQLASIFASLRQKEVLEMVAIVLIVFIALLEGIFGAISFSHTGDFTAVLLELEAAALGLQPMEDGLCYVRHPDLPMAEAQGVKWTQPGFIVAMPSAVVFLGFLAGAVYVCCSVPPNADVAPRDRH